MTPMEIVGQGISIVAMVAIVFSFQQKKQTTLAALQMVGGLLFGISYFLLGGIAGAILNVLSLLRGVLFLFPKKLNASHPAWLCGFIVLYITFYILTFTVFGVEPRPILFVTEALPVIASIAMSIGFMLGSAGKVRICGMISSPLWLTYNIYHGSIGATVCELISLGSIVIGIFRHDRKKNEKGGKL